MVLKAAFGLAFSVLGLFPGGGYFQTPGDVLRKLELGIIKKALLQFCGRACHGKIFQIISGPYP